MALEMEIKQNVIRYKYLSGRHADLAMSWAMLAWASKHPHLPAWCRPLEPRVAETAVPHLSRRGGRKLNVMPAENNNVQRATPRGSGVPVLELRARD